MGWLASQFELSRGTALHHVRSMEGMRGFAVFLVFLVHFCTLAAPWIAPGSVFSALTDTIRVIGNSGVDLFFVLSGYLIYGSLMARSQAFAPFMRRRIVRIYPAFCVVFAIYLYLSILHPNESRIPRGGYDAVVYLLQNFALLPGIFPITPLITVAWSLSYEMFFYLAIPLTISLLSLRARTSRWRIRFIFSLGMALTLYCLAYGGPLRLIMFLTGMLLHEALQNLELPPPRGRFALLALAGGLLVTALPFAGHGAGAIKMVVLAAAFFISCYGCFRGQSATLLQGFSWPPLRWLGNMSYSYYLLHGLALKVGFVLLSKVIPPAAMAPVFMAVMLPVMFAGTLLPSMALFILVERPFSLKPAPRIATA
jgi:exopolysaccharide production protein ExoZ